MIKEIFIQEKTSLIIRDLERLRIFSDMTFDEVAQDFIKYGALKNILMEIIGRAIDINEHLVVELMPNSSDVPKDYRATFLALIELDILPKDFAEEISKSAGFRNAIVHEYNNLNKGIVYKTVGEAIEQYAKYCDYVQKFLEKNKNN